MSCKIFCNILSNKCGTHKQPVVATESNSGSGSHMFKAQLTGDTFGKNLQESSCLIPISMNQPLQNGEKLQATIQLINNTFANCTIVIADSLYRHTSSQDNALAMGNTWLDKNLDTLNSITIPKTINRWDHYLQQSSFEKFITLVNDLFETNPSFHKTVYYSVKHFINRQANRIPANSSLEHNEDLYNKSLAYLKEECAVWLQWGNETPAHNFLIYPNKIYEPLTFLRKHFPNTTNETPLKALTICFRKIKQTIELTENSNNNSSRREQQRSPNTMPTTETIDITHTQLKHMVQKHIDHIFELAEQINHESKQAILRHGFSSLADLINNTNLIEETE